jgi:archaellum biogenesis protein FlaJ (TadC family)
MAANEPDWGAYLGGLAAFAGTLFALVLAARQIRKPLVENPHPKVSRAYLVDSIAVTVELGAAASLAVLYEIKESLLFSIAVVVVALSGVGLSLASAVTYAKARDHFRDDEKFGIVLQGVGNVLPLACYVVSALYAVRVFDMDSGETWGYAAAVSWLTLSGVVQSIWWYSRIWVEAAPSHSTGA